MRRARGAETYRGFGATGSAATRYALLLTELEGVAMTWLLWAMAGAFVGTLLVQVLLLGWISHRHERRMAERFAYRRKHRR